MTRRVPALAAACALFVLVSAPAHASLASIGYTMLRWLDRADIVHHDLVARIDPPNWLAEFTDDVTFRTGGSQRFHILLGKDARLDRVTDPESGAEVRFLRTLSFGALPFDIYRLELPARPASDTLRLRFEWAIDPANITIYNPFVDQNYFYLGYAALWYPHMPEESYFTADVAIVVPERYQAFAEGAAVTDEPSREISVSPGWAVRRFRTEAPVNAMGVGVGYFRTDTTVEFHPYRVEVWRPQAIATTAAQVGLAAGRAVRFLADRLGPPPVSEFRVVEFPFPGAMSFSNLSNLVYGGDLESAGVVGRDGLQFFAAHETAHKWIGSATGVRLIGAAWLLEGLAEYLGYLALTEIVGQDRAMQVFEERTYVPFTLGAGERRRSIGAIEMFDEDATWIYAKAPLVFRMLHRRLGDERFFAAVGSFLEEYRGRHVTGRDFESWVIKHAQGDPPSGNVELPGSWIKPVYGDGAGGDLSSFFGTWVRSNRMLDYALGVDLGEAGPGGEVAVTLSVRSVGEIAEPGAVEVALSFPDGTTDRVALSPGERRTFTFPSRPDEVRLDPFRWLADAKPDNNVWRAP